MSNYCATILSITIPLPLIIYTYLQTKNIHYSEKFFFLLTLIIMDFYLKQCIMMFLLIKQHDLLSLVFKPHWIQFIRTHILCHKPNSSPSFCLLL